ncbi:MAG TPA: cyclopropane-fatty-acyl-phospholipid synthase family protein [Pirellulales bacterium]|nr:cyclopropane-fatty-acyl-phospholipid synthase family protein [Pirellulales bacterium]
MANVESVSAADTLRAKATSDKWLDRYSRRLLENQLSRLQKGELTFIDGPASRRFGAVADPSQASATLRIHDPRFYSDTVLGGDLGAAEAYMRGYWSCDDLTSVFRVLIANREVLSAVNSWSRLFRQPIQRLLHWWRRNSEHGSRENIAAHYDLGNAFFALFLDETWMYSCAFFENSESTLFEASTAKNDRVCRKLRLSANDHVLEIGTGWGGFALHAAQHYGCRITTTTISQAQYELARQRIADAGLNDRVELIRTDYRDLVGQFDKLVSIEMIEAVGHAYLDHYFRQCSRLLKPTGEMLLQAITIADQTYDSYLRSVDFIQRFIFPGGCLPAVSAISASVKRSTDMQFYDLEDMTPHYARTLQCWRERFFSQLEAVRKLGYPEYFLRMWEFYFCYCEAAFSERSTQSIQLLLVKPACRHQLSPTRIVP